VGQLWDTGSDKREFDADMFKENAALPQVKMIELKLSQGAKPAHGGMLPKVRERGRERGEGCCRR
jgi:hypothetical protein